MTTQLYQEVPEFEPVLKELLTKFIAVDFAYTDGHHGERRKLEHLMIVWNPDITNPVGLTSSYNPRAFVTQFWPSVAYQSINPIHLMSDGTFHLTPYTIGPVVYKTNMELLAKGEVVNMSGWRAVAFPAEKVHELL